MSDGMAKMEMDVAEGQCYDLGILVKEEDKEIEVQQQPVTRKKARVNNPANRVPEKSKRVFQKKFNGFASWPIISL
jgi:hypothetical protein